MSAARPEQTAPLQAKPAVTTQVELCRVALPAPMSVVGVVGKVIGTAFPTALARMEGDHMALVVDQDEFDRAYERLSSEWDDEDLS